MSLKGPVRNARPMDGRSTGVSLHGEVQEFQLMVKYILRAFMVVLDTLSRDLIPKPLCQRFFTEMATSDGVGATTQTVEERSIACTLSGGFDTEALRSAQKKELARLLEGVKRGRN